MNPDGREIKQLTVNDGERFRPCLVCPGQCDRVRKPARQPKRGDLRDGRRRHESDASHHNAATADPTFSPNGGRCIRSTRASIGTADIRVEQPARLTTNAADDFDPHWSPDGSKIAFTSKRDGNNNIYVMNADGSEPKRVTKKAAFDAQPAWSPGGTKIAFRSDRGGGDPDIYAMKAKPESRKNRPINLTKNDMFDSDPDWQPIP